MQFIHFVEELQGLFLLLRGREYGERGSWPGMGCGVGTVFGGCKSGVRNV
jgi:hypothetical protein